MIAGNYYDHRINPIILFTVKCKTEAYASLKAHRSLRFRNKGRETATTYEET